MQDQGSDLNGRASATSGSELGTHNPSGIFFSRKDDTSDTPAIDSRGDEAHHATDEEFETLRKAVQAATKSPIGTSQRPRNSPLRDAAALNDIAEAFGKKAVGYTSESKVLNSVNGIVLPRSLPDYIFLNKNADRPHLAIIGHELVHHLKVSDPKLYEQFVSAVHPYLQDNYTDFHAQMQKRGYKDSDSISLEVRTVPHPHPFPRLRGKGVCQLNMRIVETLACWINSEVNG